MTGFLIGARLTIGGKLSQKFCCFVLLMYLRCRKENSIGDD